MLVFRWVDEVRKKIRLRNMTINTSNRAWNDRCLWKRGDVGAI
jgi:hypothetical protein